MNETATMPFLKFLSTKNFQPISPDLEKMKRYMDISWNQVYVDRTNGTRKVFNTQQLRFCKVEDFKGME